MPRDHALTRIQTSLGRASLLGLLLTLSTPALCQESWPPEPLPGYNIFDEQQEIWLGEVVMEEAGLEQDVIHDSQAEAYLQSLGERLVEKSKRPELGYRFFLYSSSEPNAFALPGGAIYVHVGMISFCENEAELASVLSHEIAHIALRQSAKTVSRWLLWGLGVTKVTDKNDIREKLLQLEQHLQTTNGFQRAADLLVGIARADEVWADKYGVWNVHAAGYHPAAAVALFRRWDALEKQEQGGDPWGRLLELLLSSHPPSGDRANLLQMEVAWMNQRQSATTDSEAFQKLKTKWK